MNLGKILVFTTAYNAEKTIARAMDSIISQLYQNWVFFVLNNGSEDDTELIIMDYVKRDARIQFLTVKNNQVDIIQQFRFSALRTTDADWYCTLDADDEYDITFLEKMVSFATENNLDIVACGYDKVDGLTGKLLKKKVADKNIILEGNAFVDDFIEYRGFTSFIWAKLISIKFYRENFMLLRPNVLTWDPVLDSKGVLKLFRRAERAGVYGEALYTYYSYPNSLINTFSMSSFNYYLTLFTSTREYIQSYGEVSKEHKDFLQAIYLSLFDECYQKLKQADVSIGKKLTILMKMLSHRFSYEMFICKADPQFKNLAARGEYKQGIRDWVFSLKGVEVYNTTTTQIIQLLGDAVNE